MSRKLVCLCCVSLMIGALYASVLGVGVVHAQSSTPASACMTCHEDQYYLHDSGKWYCVDEAQERCVNCHAGNARALNEQEAHTGLIAQPLSDGGQRCQTCHAQETEALVQKVIGQTGFHATIKTDAYLPQTSVSNAQPVSLPTSSEPQAPLWYFPAAIAVFALWVKLVIHTSRA